MLPVLDQGIGDSLQSAVLGCRRQRCQPQGGVLGALCTLLYVHGSLWSSLAIAIDGGVLFLKWGSFFFFTFANDIQGLLEGFEPLFLGWPLAYDQPDNEWKAHKALGSRLATLVGGGNIILQAWTRGHPIRYHCPITMFLHSFH